MQELCSSAAGGKLTFTDLLNNVPGITVYRSTHIRMATSLHDRERIDSLRLQKRACESTSSESTGWRAIRHQSRGRRCLG